MADPCIDFARILYIARTWIGTPYRHQQSTLGVGADCLGLVRGVWSTYYDRELIQPPPYTRDWAETRQTSLGEPLLDAANHYLTKIPPSQAVPGDVLLVRMRATAAVKHCAFISGVGMPAKNGCIVQSIIHAYLGHGVVEGPMHVDWIRKDLYYFRFK